MESSQPFLRTSYDSEKYPKLDTNKSAPLLSMAAHLTQLQNKFIQEQTESPEESHHQLPRRLQTEVDKRVNTQTDMADIERNVRPNSRERTNLQERHRSSLTGSNSQRFAQSIPISKKARETGNFKLSETKSSFVFVNLQQDFQRLKPVIVQ